MGSGANIAYGIDQWELDKKREELLTRKVLDWRGAKPLTRLRR